MEVRASADARAANPSDLLTLTNHLARLDSQLRKMGIERSASGTAVLQFNRESVAADPTTANHRSRQSRHHGGAGGRGVIPAVVHQPTTMHRMNPHPEITADHGQTEEGAAGRSGSGPGPQGDGRPTLLTRDGTFPTGLLPLGHIDRLNRCTQTHAQVFVRRDHPLLLKPNQGWLELHRGWGPA